MESFVARKVRSQQFFRTRYPLCTSSRLVVLAYCSDVIEFGLHVIHVHPGAVERGEKEDTHCISESDEILQFTRVR